MAHRLILASASPFRNALLGNAGLAFDAVPPSVDERAIEETLTVSGATPSSLAVALAEAKARDVAQRFPEALVIGADQTLSLDGRVFHKPADMGAARQTIQSLSGKTHHLNSGVAIAHGRKVLWRLVDTARLTMRPLSSKQIEHYLEWVGQKALSSVGAYQIEGEGIRLFESIEGDYFTIIGLPLLPLLAALRALGGLDD